MAIQRTSRRRPLDLFSHTERGRLARGLRPRLEGLEDRTLLASADLVVTQTVPATVLAGTSVTYTITLTNNGPDPAQNVELDDTYPTAGVASGLNPPPGFSISFLTTGFTATVPSLAPASPQTFTLIVNTFSSQASGDTLTNTATATTTTPDPNNGNNTASATSTVQTSADLSIVKTGPATAAAGTTITYTLTATNTGPSDAQDYNLSDTFNGNANLGNFVQVSGPPSGGVLPAGQTAVFTLAAQIPASDPAGAVLHNTGSVFSSTSDPNTGNNTSSTIDTTVTTSADLTITKTGPATAVAGSIITYTLTATNDGPSDAQSYIVVDSLSGDASFASGLVQVSGPSSGGVLPAGQTAVFTIAVDVSAAAPSGSSFHDAGSVFSPTSDPNTTNNSSAIDTTVVTQADLAVTKTASPGPVLLGGNITYTLTAANNGPSDAQSVSLLDTLPAGTAFLSETQTGGPAFTLNHPAPGTGGVVSDTIATLPAGATASFVLVVQTQSRLLNGATVTNTATISSATFDPNAGNNSATATTQVFSQADLSVTKSGQTRVISGTNLTYTLTLTNNGPIFDPEVVLEDAVPANTTFVSQTQTSGPAFTAFTPPVGGTGLISWEINSLAAGVSASFRVVVHVNFDAPNQGLIVNTATASGSLTDPNLANNTATVRTLATTPTADLSITGVSIPNPLKAAGSGPLTYALTVTNIGPNSAINVVVTDVLPFAVGFAGEIRPPGWSSIDPPVGGQGNVVFRTLALDPGATVTFFIVVKAPPPPAGASLIDTAAVTSATFDPNLLNNSVAIVTHVQ